jgi:hypothetical protein
MTDLQQLSPVNVQILTQVTKYSCAQDFFERSVQELQRTARSHGSRGSSSGRRKNAAKSGLALENPDAFHGNGGGLRIDFGTRMILAKKKTRRKSQEDGLIDVNSPKVECFEAFFVWTN